VYAGCMISLLTLNKFANRLYAVVDGRQKFKITATHQLSNAMHTSGWQNFYWLVEFVFD